MSTPVAAGAVALVRQYFMQGWYPTGAPVAANVYTPSGPLLKAIIVGELLYDSTCCAAPCCALCTSVSALVVSALLITPELLYDSTCRAVLCCAMHFCECSGI